MSKKVKKGILALLTLVSLSASVYAVETTQEVSVVDGETVCSCGYTIQEHDEFEETKNPNARYQPCLCGGREQTTLVYTEDWVYTGEERDCSHLAYGYDYEQEQIKRYKNWCASCGYVHYYDVVSTRWVCKGFNS